ncbi:MAG: sensor histidine kinase [Bacteroidales bacterium]
MLPARFRPPHHLFALFVAVILVPAATLTWLASRTLAQDRALERQAVQDRLEHAATTLAADLRQRLDDLVARLSTLANAPDRALPSEGVLVTVTADVIDARPRGRLVYYPQVPPDTAFRRTALEGAEALEYRDQNAAAAAHAYRAAAETRELGQRAAALLGLARCLRKSGRGDAALPVYEELGRIDARVDSAPADLVARAAHARLLLELQRPEAAAQAALFVADLHAGRWVLDRATYELYREETAAWRPGGESATDPMKLAMSEAMCRVVHDRPWEPHLAEGREVLWAGGQSIVAAWRTSGAVAQVLLVPASWIQESSPVWADLNAAVAIVDADGHRVLGDPGTLARPLVVRQPADSGLPWVLHVAAANRALDAVGFAGRRQLVLGTVLFVGILVLGAAVIVARSLSRDDAVRRTQAEFVATVSHEFRSPLTSMSHLIEMLESGDVTAEDRRRRYYSVLGRETRRLRRLVENLLDFRRMEVGRVEYRHEQVDVGRLVREVAEDFATELGSRDRLTLEAGDAQMRVRGDAEALSRAVWNLLDNAAKYSPPSSPIRLVLAAGDSVAKIQVVDRGDGIPAEEQADVFRPFYRGAAASASGVKGTGIGLATVAHIARAHGGDVRVDSTEGTGSTFTISLPLEES